MADGRCFTSYIPNCVLNTNIQKAFKINEGKSYRSFLQTNAKDIMDGMRDLSYSDNTKSCIKLEYKK